MFFDDPGAAFANVRRALRPAGRLVMMVWQAPERNEWDVAIRQSLGSSRRASGRGSGGSDAVLARRSAAVTEILEAAGFADVAFTGVHEPVYYGPDVTTDLGWVRGFTGYQRSARTGRLPTPRSRAVGRLREMLAAHLSDDGVWFDSRAWIVGAQRVEAGPHAAQGNPARALGITHLGRVALGFLGVGAAGWGGPLMEARSASA